MKRTLSAFILIACFASCTHKAFVPIAVPVPVTGCDTSVITYSKDIKPVLSGNCYSCHGTSVTQSGGLDLENFVSLKNYLQQGFRGDGIYGSKLYHCMLHATYALPMPPTNKLDTCSLNKMKRWIDEGGLDN